MSREALKAKHMEEELEYESLKVAVEEVLQNAQVVEPLTIPGKPDRPGYIYLKDRNLSVNERIVAEQSDSSQTELKSAQALKEFLDDRKFLGRTDFTRAMYKSVLERFLAPYEHVPTDHNIVRGFLAQFKQNTRQAYWLRFSAFYGFLEQRYSIPNPMRKIRIPSKDKSLPDHLNPEQRVLLESALPRLSQRDGVMIKLLLETGLRPGEVADPKDHLLRFCDIFQDHLEISGKTGERIVPIMLDLRASLLLQQNGRSADSPVFLSDKSDTYLTTWGLRKVVKRAFELAGITGVRPSPYTLRHSFAADFLERGGDLASLQKIMGHHDIKTTMIYTHISDRQVIETFKRTRANNTL